MRRVLALAVVVLGVIAPTATAATTLNIIPHGQGEPGVSVGHGSRHAAADTQARMYDRLTPLFRDVTDAQLVPSADGTGFYKSAALLDRERPVVRHQRDRRGHRRRRRRGERARSSATPTACRTSTATPTRA